MKKNKEQTVKPEQDINKILPGPKEINKPAPESRPYDEVIEESRLNFNKSFKKGRRNSYIMMAAVLVAAIASVICIGMSEMAWKIVGWVICGVAVVGMLVYYIITRNNVPGQTKDYIALVNEQLNMRNFADNRFTEVTTDEKEKMELSEIIPDGIYSNLNNIASRNVINGKFNGRTFKVADVGLYSGSGKSRTSAFVGKYVSYPNELHFEGRYILVLKGATALDQPTDIEDLKPVLEEDNFIIYGKENSKPEVDLGKEFIKAIKDIKINDHLLNLNAVLWAGHSAVFCSYDDQIMTLPFQNVFNKAYNEQYADNLLAIMEALSSICKE